MAPTATRATWPELEAVDELTVKFTLCNPDVALPSKVAFSSLQIQPQEYIDSTGGTGAFVEEPIGTGPYKLEEWERGSQIVLDRRTRTTGARRQGADRGVPLVRRRRRSAWSSSSPGAVDGIDNVGASDFATVEGDSSLQLIERDPLNVFYLGFNVDKEPFNNEARAPGDRLRHRQGAPRLELLPCRLGGGDAVPAAAASRSTTRAPRRSPPITTGPVSCWPRLATPTGSTSP